MLKHSIGLYRSFLMSRLEWLTNLFPLWVLLTAIVALLYPPLFLWVSSDLIP